MSNSQRLQLTYGALLPLLFVSQMSLVLPEHVCLRRRHAYGYIVVLDYCH